MKILYDHQIFDDQYFGGASIYFVNLVNNLSRLGLAKIDLAMVETVNVHLIKDKEPPYVKKAILAPSMFLPWLKIRGKGELRRRLVKIGLLSDYQALNRQASLAKIKEGNYDVFHATHYNKYWETGDIKKPIVTTVHDMTYERLPEYFQKDDPYPSKKARSVLEATRIIAVSENTKRDLVEILNIDPSIVDVVYQGLTLDIDFERIPGRFGKKPYILYVGTRKGYKNFLLMLYGFREVVKQYPDLYLICAGASPFNHEELTEIKRLELQGKVKHQQFVNKKDLASLYKGAECFVFPSLYEGFGLPLLESLAAGCPLVLSKASCFPEIVGDAGVYFNPSDPSDIAKAIERVLAMDSVTRTKQELLGRARAANFSWEFCARETEKVYRRACGLAV